MVKQLDSTLSSLGKRDRNTDTDTGTEFQISLNGEPLRKKAKKQEASLSLDELPNEILLKIASYLSTQDAAALNLVCHRFDALIKAEQYPLRFNISTLVENEKLSLEEAKKIWPKIKAQQEELELVGDALALTVDETNKLSKFKEISEPNLQAFNEIEKWLDEVNADHIIPGIERSLNEGVNILWLNSKGLTRFPLAYLFRNEEYKEYFLALRKLQFGCNKLTSIPVELGQLENLEELLLHKNQLSGPIPPELGNLKNLKGLYLHENQLSGPIPPELGQLENLEVLNLSENQFSGPIPPELGQLENLKRLYLYSNQLSGPILPELGKLINLEWLHLNKNQLSGPIPPELGQLGNLRGLYLNDNQLSGPISGVLLERFGAASFANQRSLEPDRVEVDNTERPQAGNRPRM